MKISHFLPSASHPPKKAIFKIRFPLLFSISILTQAVALGAAVSPIPTPDNLNQCKLLSLSAMEAAKKGDLQRLNSSLSLFEKAFAEEDSTLFRKILHPALLLNPTRSKELFNNTFATYGLEKPKLIRTAIYELNFASEGEPVANCQSGRIRGVVGIKTQYAVFHSIATSQEQIKFLSLFAPVLPALMEKNKNAEELGLVMWQVGLWTAGQQNPESLLKEAQKWGALNENFNAWVFAEAAHRLLTSNPYFIPLNLDEAKAAVNNYSSKLPNAMTLNERLQKQKLDWEFLDFTTVFQAQGAEPGIKFRMKKTEAIPDMLKKCEKHIQTIFNLLGDLKARFSGIECLPYNEKEPVTNAPAIGTAFIKLDSIKETK